MQSTLHYQILQAGRLYGTTGGLIRNASVVIDPNGKIAAVGPADAIARECRERAAADPDLRLAVEQHEVVLPALTDTHNHPILWGEFQAMRPASLSGITDEADLARCVGRQLDGRSGLQLALGWDTSALPHLNRQTLDTVRREPLVAMDMSFHGACANTTAMALIERHVEANRLRGRLAGDMSRDGKLTEQYAALGFDILEDQTDLSTLGASVEEYVAAMHAGGTAYAHEMNLTTLKQLEVLLHLTQQVKETLRILHISPGLLRAAIAAGREVSHFHLKLFADGSNGSRTALYYEPYLDTEQPGLQYHHESEAAEAMELALDHGIRHLSTHAIGDRGIDVALGFCEIWRSACEARSVEGRARIEHMSVPRPASIERAAEMGIWVSLQPNFLPDMIAFADRLDEERLRRMVPLRTMLDAGLRVMLGTDGMPNSMLLALHCAITAPHASQRLTLEEAIHAATVTAPSYERANRGMIAVGLPADLLLTTHRMVERLEGDSGLFECAPEALSAKMDTIAADLSQEVRGVIRDGQLVTINETGRKCNRACESA